MRGIGGRRRTLLALVLPMLACGAAAPSIYGQQGFQGGLPEALGTNYEAQPDNQPPPPRQLAPRGKNTLARVRYWNQVAIDSSGVDHTPVQPGEDRVFGEQLGPARTSRAFAIVHIAIFDSVNSVMGGYEGYTGLRPAPAGTSVDAAIAMSAHDTLAALYPSQTPRFDQFLTHDLAQIPDTRAKTMGVDLGKRAAAAILALRSNDGFQYADPLVGIQFITSNLPGKWRQDPISQIPLALGAYWKSVQPFVLSSATQFRAPPPPALTSSEYTRAFNETKRLGGDGVTTPTQRTPEQTFIGMFWGYDGTPSMGTPPRLYNQLAVQIAAGMGTDAVSLARLLALVNVSLADTAIATWESKYYYQFWRPVTAIRESDPGTGPTGRGDGNPATHGDPEFSPLGAQASNLTGPNFTPPFPAYPSGHAGFGGALFEILRQFYGTDDIAFTFTSDEFDGITRDNQGNVRPLMPRSFTSLSDAEDENGQSRIYLGIHWRFDKMQGIELGNAVGDYVFANAFRPLSDYSR